VELFFLALLVAVVLGMVLSFFLSLTLFHPHARPGSIVARSDRRSAATGWLFAAGLFVPPLAIVAMLVLLAIDGRAWLASLRAALRQRRDQPPRDVVDFGLGHDWVLEPSPSVPYRASAGPVLGSLGSPRASAWAIAGNMARLGLAATATTLWFATWDCGPRPRHSEIAAARTALATARQATVIWRQGFPDAPCPTVDQLKAAKVLDVGFNSKDPWGNAIELTCDGAEIRARTAGPDRRLGTTDDIRIPSQERADETPPALAHRGTPAYIPNNPR
jgi:hypothetical protein